MSDLQFEMEELRSNIREEFKSDIGWIRRKWRRFMHGLRRFPWEFRWRWVKWHQYHVIRPRTLKPGYHDSDERMLHACMETLVEHYELLRETNPSEVWDGADYGLPDDVPDIWSPARREMKAIYDWWTTERPKRVKDLDDFISLKWKSGGEETRRFWELEEAGNAEDQVMLHRLVDVRFSMWD